MLEPKLARFARALIFGPTPGEPFGPIAQSEKQSRAVGPPWPTRHPLWKPLILPLDRMRELAVHAVSRLELSFAVMATGSPSTRSRCW